MKLQIEQSWKKVLRVKTKTKKEKKLLKKEKKYYIHKWKLQVGTNKI